MSDIIIIGNGPAGISASLYISRSGIDVTVIGMDGGALQKTDKIENYYGFSNGISGRKLIEEGINQAKNLGVTIVSDEVLTVSYDGNFNIVTTNGTYTSKSIILATGASRKTPNIKGIKEFEGMGISYCAVCDAFFFRGKSVAVVGNEEYALHECIELLPIVGAVTLLTNGNEHIGNIPDGVEIINSEIEEFCGNQTLEYIKFKNGEKLKAACAFIAMGVAGSGDFARKLGVETNNGEIITDENMSTTIPGLFACGDCNGGMLQIAKAVHEGAIAGISAIKYVRQK